MNLNYLILAHKTPKQVLRLIDSLNSPNSYFFVHLDKNKAINDFNSLINYHNVHFLEDFQRKEGMWGDIGIIEGTLQGLYEINKKGGDGFCILLSGQDYPLSTPEHISKFLKEKINTIFMDVFPIPSPNWINGGLNRINKYKINWSNGRGDFFLLSSIFQKDFYTLSSLGKIKYLIKKKKFHHLKLIFVKRTFPPYLKPYGGSQWFALPLHSVENILNFVSAHPDYLEYHRYTLLPDEMFFQSIIMHIKKYDPSDIEPSLTYTNWTRKKGSIPVIFSREDLDELKTASKKKLFARKFDLSKDYEILDLIDKNLLGK